MEIMISLSSFLVVENTWSNLVAKIQLIPSADHRALPIQRPANGICELGLFPSFLQISSRLCHPYLVPLTMSIQ